MTDLVNFPRDRMVHKRIITHRCALALIAMATNLRDQPHPIRVEEMNFLRDLLAALELPEGVELLHKRMAERDANIIAERREGATMREIARRYSLTIERVRQICQGAGLPKGRAGRPPHYPAQE